MTYVSTWMDTPVGRLRLVASDHGLVAVLWPEDSPRRVKVGDPADDDTNSFLIQARHELAGYFAGERRTFSVPLDLHGTPFQQSVWRALLTIPYSETRSYAQLAAQLGDPRAVRAVGAANGRNPVSVMVPCHRVIGTNGHLTGFAGGLEVKAGLLELEKHGTRPR